MQTQNNFGNDLDEPMFPDYAALEAEDRAIENKWLNRFPWLTGEERSVYHLADHPDFPGVCAEDEQYDAFAVRMQRDSERVVPCQFDAGWGKVRGAFDLVTGVTYLVDNGAYVLSGDELPSTVTIIFADEPQAVLHRVELVEGIANVTPVQSSQDSPRLTLAELLSGQGRPVSVQSISNVVEHLARVNKLPPVQASVNGQRFGTFHPTGRP